MNAFIESLETKSRGAGHSINTQPPNKKKGKKKRNQLFK